MFSAVKYAVWPLLILGVLTTLARADVVLSKEQADRIGRLIWRNECAGTVAGLTSWNAGEEFPSLGIAHFIWYPEGVRGPFVESWPGLARFLESRGHRIEPWMKGACPWSTRTSFLADRDGDRLRSLRQLLSESVSDQAIFAARRLQDAVPRMLAAAPPEKRSLVEKNFRRVAAEPTGYYALVDYVNFKGEGIDPRERYRGEGWGLLQVLEAMPASGSPLTAFSRAADKVLTRRVENSPPARGEARWLPGWRNRLKTYLP